jgi:hypothetical protein
MLKGQLMLVAPLFIFWPLFLRQWRAAIDVTLAFLTAIALITAPWTLGHGAIHVATAVAVTWFLTRRWKISPWRTRTILAVGITTLFLCPLFFGGSMVWFKIGFTYGAAKFPDMALDAENLAAVLHRSFALRCQDTALAIPPLHLLITVKQLLTAAYFATLILASWAAARHRARNDPRFLIAAIMPWLLFFALLTQMHERYLVWAACLSACWIAAGPIMTLLHLLITALAFLIMAKSMTAPHPNAWPAMTDLIRITSPALACTVLIAAGLATLASLTKSRPSRAT